MEILWHSTACIELRNASGRLLFDPFRPLKGSNIHVDADTFDDFSDIFITHGHFDHIAYIPAIYRRNPTVMIHCTKTPYNTLRRKGIPEENLHLIAPDQTFHINGFTVSTYPGKHAVLPKASSRMMSILTSPHVLHMRWILQQHIQCRENQETLFYQVMSEGCQVSLMGSLNLCEDVSYPTQSDALILPYNGWDDNYPMAVVSIYRLNPRRVLLDHYDNAFPPLTQPLDITPILNYDPERVEALKLNEPVSITASLDETNL